MDGCIIRRATSCDLDRIRAWLQHDHNEGAEGSFVGNYRRIENGQRAGSLTVLARDSDDFPVAFCLGDDSIEIFAVKSNCRGEGLGRCLAESFIDAARQRDVIGLHGECAPRDSKGFWTKMGFEPVPSPSGDDNKFWVARPLPHENGLQNGAGRDTIAITVEDNNGQMQPMFQSDAAALDDRWLLACDFVRYVPHPDRVISITRNGIQIFSKKAKYVPEVGGERKAPWIRVRELIAS